MTGYQQNLPAKIADTLSTNMGRASGAKTSGTEERFTPPLALKMLGRPALLKGEKSAAYDRFLEEMAKELKPHGLQEWLLVDQITHRIWLDRRYRKGEAALMEFDIESKEHVLAGLTRERLKEMFGESAVAAQARTLKQHIDYLERLRCIMDENWDHRDVHLRELCRLQAERKSNKQNIIDLQAEEVSDV
jgi:hypothetical protein